MKTSRIILSTLVLLGVFYCQEVCAVGTWTVDTVKTKDSTKTETKTMKLEIKSAEDLQNLLKMFSGQLNGKADTSKQKNQPKDTTRKVIKMNLSSPEDLQKLLQMFSGKVGTEATGVKAKSDSTKTITKTMQINSVEDLQNLMKMFGGQAEKKDTAANTSTVKAVKKTSDVQTTVNGRPAWWGKSVLNQKAPAMIIDTWITDKPKTDGKFMLWHYWGTTCGPCKLSIPKLNEWNKTFKKDLVVIGFARDDAKNKDNGIKYYRTADVRTFDPLDLHVLSYVLLVDPKGMVCWEGICKDLTTEKIKEIMAKYESN